MRRYPFADLAAAMRMSEHAAAVQLGLSGSTEQTYRRDGLSEKVADRLAVKAGLHPVNVWVDYIDYKDRSSDAARWMRRYRNNPEFRERRKAYMEAYRVEAARSIAAQKRRYLEANRDQHRASTREAMRRYRARRKAVDNA